MTLSHDETKRLLELVLRAPIGQARDALQFELRDMGRTEPEFCDGVMKHGPYMDFTSDQWFDFFLKIPNKLFHDEVILMNKLSENQRAQLLLR